MKKIKSTFLVPIEKRLELFQEMNRTNTIDQALSNIDKGVIESMKQEIEYKQA